MLPVNKRDVGSSGPISLRKYIYSSRENSCEKVYEAAVGTISAAARSNVPLDGEIDSGLYA